MDREKFGRIRWRDHIGSKCTGGNTDGTKRRRKYGNYDRKCWYPLRTLDIEPGIRNKLFKKLAPFKEHFFPRRNYVSLQKLSKVISKEVDTSAYLSISTIAINADEPPVNRDLVNSKPKESAIHGDSKKTTTKEKSNTETNIKSNASNSIER